jgi:hypothetical protein
MKYIIFFIATIVLYSLNISIVNARTQGNIDYLDTCNKAINVLKSFGFNYNKFTTSSNFIRFSGTHITCAFPPGADVQIFIMPDPIRIFVTDPGSYSQGSCIFLSTRQMTKIRSHQC